MERGRRFAFGDGDVSSFHVGFEVGGPSRFIRYAGFIRESGHLEFAGGADVLIRLRIRSCGPCERVRGA